MLFLRFQRLQTVDLVPDSPYLSRIRRDMGDSGKHVLWTALELSKHSGPILPQHEGDGRHFEEL